MMFDFQNKNVVFLLKSFELGGAEKQALFFANYLKNNKNCSVFIYSYLKAEAESSNLFYKECEKYGLKNIYLVTNPLSASGKFKYLKRRIKIAFFGLRLRKHKPDIIIPYLNPPSIISILSYKFSGAKHTFWHHRGPDFYRNDLLERKAASKNSLFIANSPDGKKELLKQFPYSKGNFYFIPNFYTIQPSEIKKNENNPFKQSKDTVVIGMIAHFRIQKLQHLLVEAVNLLIKQGYNLHLVLVGNIQEGEGEMSNYELTKDKIAEYSLEKKVTILHNKAGVELLPYFDIGVLVSIKEGMPNVIMEYMSFGLAVVASDHEGCLALLGNDYPFFIKNNSLDDLRSRLITILSNEDFSKKIGIQNKKRLLESFFIENYILDITYKINNEED